MADEQVRRAPARPKELEDVDPQSDIRIRVTGTVLSVDEDSASIDDGTGSVEAFMEEEQLDKIGEGDRVRVLGRVLPTPDGFELQAEAVQGFDVDPELEDRVKKIVNTIG